MEQLRYVNASSKNETTWLAKYAANVPPDSLPLSISEGTEEVNNSLRPPKHFQCPFCLLAEARIEALPVGTLVANLTF